MAVKSTRYLDAQGRIILPSHIRKHLNLAPGGAVSVELDENGTIKIRPVEERCAICGEAVTEEATTIKAWNGQQKICGFCVRQIMKSRKEK